MSTRFGCCATFATAKRGYKRGIWEELKVKKETEKSTEYADRGFAMQNDGRSVVVDGIVFSTPESGGGLLCVESGRWKGI